MNKGDMLTKIKRFGFVPVIAIVLGITLIGLSGIDPGPALGWPGDPTPDEILVRTPAPPPEMPTLTPVSPGGPSLSTTEVIVDDLDSGFQLYGPSGGWQHSGSGDTTYNGHAYWTYCTNTWEGPSVNNWAIWTPNLPVSGQWEVFAYIPYVITGRPDTGRARYQIHTASGDYVVERNQDNNTGWISLGTYTFNAGTSGYVRLEDVTPDWYFVYGGQQYRKTIKFDAMKWISTAGRQVEGFLADSVQGCAGQTTGWGILDCDYNLIIATEWIPEFQDIPYCGEVGRDLVYAWVRVEGEEVTWPNSCKVIVPDAVTVVNPASPCTCGEATPTPTPTSTRTPTRTPTPTLTLTPTPTGPCADNDGDGLCNDWELYGHNGVDLPAMGADPNHIDIFVEIDYMVDPGFCVGGVCVFGHSHKPKPEAIAKVVQAFKDAPVSNPDGIHGINLHVDFGPETPMKPDGATWGSLSRSNALPHDNDLSWTEFYALKNTNFDAARRQIFHYAIFAHYLDGARCTSGQAPMPGGDLIVSLGGWGSMIAPEACLSGLAPDAVGTVDQQAGTFMHELGHNLGLNHGGSDGVNYKPNYLSVMSYAFQTRGLIYSGQEGTFDYSRSDTIPLLEESHLNEAVGLNGGSSTASYGTRWFCGASDGEGKWTNAANSPIDWNCNGNANQTNVQADINRSGSSSEILIGYFDWAHLDYRGGGAIGPLAVQAVQVASTLPKELTFEEDSRLFTPYRVGVSGPGEVQVAPGTMAVYDFTVTNLGRNPDVYTLSASSSQGWADLSGVPSSVSLAPGASRDITIRITVPTSAQAGEVDGIRLAATSQASPRIANVAYAYTRLKLVSVVYLPLILKNYCSIPGLWKIGAMARDLYTKGPISGVEIELRYFRDNNWIRYGQAQTGADSRVEWNPTEDWWAQGSDGTGKWDLQLMVSNSPPGGTPASATSDCGGTNCSGYNCYNDRLYFWDVSVVGMTYTANYFDFSWLPATSTPTRTSTPTPGITNLHMSDSCEGPDMNLFPAGVETVYVVFDYFDMQGGLYRIAVADGVTLHDAPHSYTGSGTECIIVTHTPGPIPADIYRTEIYAGGLFPIKTLVWLVVPGPPANITVSADPTSISVGGFTSTVQANVTDAYGNPVADGTVVTFTTSLGTISPPIAYTVYGVAVATLTSGSTPGTATVTARSGSVVSTTTVTFT